MEVIGENVKFRPRFPIYLFPHNDLISQGCMFLCQNYPEFPLQWHHHQHLSPVKLLFLLFTKFLYTYKNYNGSRYKKFCKKYLFTT